MRAFCRVAQHGRHLPILQLACCSQVLARYSHRVRSFFEKARFIDDPDPLVGTYRLDHKSLQPVARRIGIPGHSVQQPLHAIGDAIPYRFGDLPTILAVGLGEEPAQILLRLFARLAPLKQVGKPRVKLFKLLLPLFQFLNGHLLPPNRFLSSSVSTIGT